MPRLLRPFLLVVPLVLMGAGSDPVTVVLLRLAVVLAAAKLGGELAERVGQPAVLGELLAGVALGNADLLGLTGVEGIAADPAVDMLARLGVLVLLFEVGIEHTVRQMLQVGRTALLVAIVGVAVPFGLGWLAGAVLLPGHSPYVHAFLGATLCATSVGITARVLQDLGAAKSAVARVILGAAVIDDVLGLIVLAVVTGVIAAVAAGTSMGAAAVLAIVAKATVFLVGSLSIGLWVAPRLFRAASLLRTRGAQLATGLVFCFLLAWLSGAVGLAPIVGAFAAGLILEELHFRDFTERGEHGLEELVKPIAGFLSPVFFVLMGMRTDLAAFAQGGVVGLAAVLTIVAVLGKQACSLVVPGSIDRLTVGIGMVPRGEVGLIFANVGLSLTVAGEPVIGAATYSAVVVMVIVTTMITPPALKWSLARRRPAPAPEAPPSRPPPPGS